MVRLYGRAQRGQRLVDAAPHGHWKTSTFIAGLRQDGLVAPCVFNGAINGELFLAYVEQMLLPRLRTATSSSWTISPLTRWPACARRSRQRAPVAVPAALQSRSQPDRTGLRQTQSIAARQGSANRRGTLECSWRHCRLLLASRVCQLPPPCRIFLVILKMLFCNGPLGVNPFRADPVAGVSLLSGVGLRRHLMVSDEDRPANLGTRVRPSVSLSISGLA